MRPLPGGPFPCHYTSGLLPKRGENTSLQTPCGVPRSLGRLSAGHVGSDQDRQVRARGKFLRPMRGRHMRGSAGQCSRRLLGWTKFFVGRSPFTVRRGSPDPAVWPTGGLRFSPVARSGSTSPPRALPVLAGGSNSVKNKLCTPLNLQRVPSLLSPRTSTCCSRIATEVRCETIVWACPSVSLINLWVAPMATEEIVCQHCGSLVIPEVNGDCPVCLNYLGGKFNLVSQGLAEPSWQSEGSLDGYNYDWLDDENPHGIAATPRSQN